MSNSNFKKANVALSLLVTAVVLVAGCAAPKDPSYVQYITPAKDTQNFQSSIVLQGPSEPGIPILGYLDTNYVGTEPYGMMYPAGDLATGVAAVLTHSFIVEKQKDGLRKEAYVKANFVASPYKPHFSNYSIRQWLQTTLPNINHTVSGKNISVTDNQQGNAELVFSFQPTFFIYQDQKNIEVRNAIRIYDKLKPNHVLYQNIVEVVSNDAIGEPNSYWLNNDAKNLEAIGKELFEISLVTGLKDYYALFQNPSKEKTFKIDQGGIISFERGTLVYADCDRFTVRMLRGWLKSLPKKAGLNLGKDSIGCSTANAVSSTDTLK